MRRTAKLAKLVPRVLVEAVDRLDQALDAIGERIFAVEAERLLVVGGHAADDERDERHVLHDHVLAV